MPQSQVFTLPAGVDATVRDGLIHLHYDGDVVLECMGGALVASVRAEGDLTVLAPLAKGDLSAGGKLTLTGSAEVGRLEGEIIEIRGAQIKARAITASKTILIHAAHLTVDVLIAPEIRVDPSADGRVTVIESLGEVGPSKIKGGFSLKEYEEIFGNSLDFLADRGLKPLSQEGSASPSAAQAAPKPSAPVTPAQAPPRAPAEVAQRAAEKPAPVTPAKAVKREVVPVEDDEDDDDDPQTLRVEDMEPLEDDLFLKLDEALKKIQACYVDIPQPEAVTRLERLIAAREYGQLRVSITEIWNALLKFHQEKSLRPHHLVTHAFNQIHGLIQNH